MRSYMKNYNMPGCGMQNEMECSRCRDEASYIRPDFAIAMAYVPWQQFGGLYEPEKGFETGTIFSELDKPFLGRRGMLR